MTILERARLSLHVRAIVGILAVVVALILLVGNPGVTFAWMEEHKLLDLLIAAIAAVFHVWNTYEGKIVVP